MTYMEHIMVNVQHWNIHHSKGWINYAAFLIYWGDSPLFDFIEKDLNEAFNKYWQKICVTGGTKITDPEEIRLQEESSGNFNSPLIWQERK